MAATGMEQVGGSRYSIRRKGTALPAIDPFNMKRSSEVLVLAFVDASWAGGKEASIYGTPAGLRRLAEGFRQSVASSTSSTLFMKRPSGPMIETGLNLTLELSSDLIAVGESAFKNTLRFRKIKRDHYNEESLEYTTRRVSSCRPRDDGAFAVAYPMLGPELSLVVAGNAKGILHIASHLDGMAEIEYESYNPNWPEHSEHYHSWIDGEQDVMLDCGLGLVYGRLDHRKDGSVAWMLVDRVPNSEELELLL
jgi:hypothetical protein